MARYRAFVAEGRNQPSPWRELRHQIYLGDAQLVSTLQSGLAKDKDLKRNPRRPAPPLDHFAGKYRDRDQAIAMAYQSGGYRLKAIGEYFDLHYSRVSRIVAAAEKAKCKTPFL